MTIIVEINGARQTVGKTELADLAARGVVQPTTRLWLDGQETTCGNVKGLVFGAAAQSGVPFPTASVPPNAASGEFADAVEQNKRVSTPFLDYMIGGGSTPYVICYLEPGRAVCSSAGGRVWMKGDVDTQNQTQGGIWKSIGRAVSGETLFMSSYTARGPAEVAFTTKLPGAIVPRLLANGDQVVCQRGAFLAASPGVKIEIFFQKRLGAGFFGGEGFIMQKITGPGIVFLELSGAAYDYQLARGERVVCDTGALAWMDATCQIDIEMVKGIKNIFFGGEGLFNTIVTGPGRATFQSMSAKSAAEALIPFIPRQN